MTNAFTTQASLNRVRGRGGQGRGRIARGPPHTEDRTIHENSYHSENSHNSQGQSGRGKICTNNSNIQCNYCKKYGHYEREYRKKQADQNNGRANVSKEAQGSS